jgi:hypothetical protein
MTRHSLKVNPQFWPSIKAGTKPFCIRRDDRKFAVGDVCVFEEFNPEFGYTRSGVVELPVTYILKHEDFPNGLQPGFVVLGFGLNPLADDHR